ncbi:MAG: amidophosphoribosyltransferase, partial [Pseudonocardia sp.]|nr:amidophosphoribosyltransferase [Pseudonocardia sp.]
TEGVRRSVGADTLGYVSLEGLIAATEQPRTRLCSACFDGEYPIPLPDEARLGKHLLEGVSGSASGDPGPTRPTPSAERVPTESVGYGAAGALKRP